MAVDLELARRHMERVASTPDDVINLAAEVRREQAVHNHSVSSAGIPPQLRSLLESAKKAEAIKICKDLAIAEFHLFLLIHNCAQMSFKHRSKFPEYVPDHLVITDQDTSKMKRGEVRTVSKKLKSLLLERRHIHVHLFERGTEWHCFYFSYDDIQPEDLNHWVHGPHLHYVSHLWPNHTKDRILSSFDRRKTEIAGKVHIRFIPFDYSDETWAPSAPSLMRSQGVGLFAFAAEPAIGRGSQPTPTAQIATRGSWIVNVSIPDQ